ncbi:MAG: asparagine synthase C-terminal domain-containing protein, partial [Candidatus Micrarchaeia archaeon]
KIKNEKFEIQKEKWADILDYYKLPKEKISLDEAILKTKEALLDSVKYHLVADVPVGLFLSGGIDSSVLLYLMRELGKEKIQTVSAIFPSTFYDESEKINELVKIFKSEHLELKITGENFLEHLDNIFYYMDQPTVDGVNTYFVSLAAKKAGLKVVLSGLGGDELFYGYPSFFDLPKIRKFKPFLRFLSFYKVLKLLGNFNMRYQKLYEIIKAKNLEEEYLIYRSIFTENQIKNIIQSYLSTNSDYIFKHSYLFANSDKFGSNSDYGLISHLEMSHYLKNQLLRDSDVFSMAHSIELRVPFVDNVLFEKIISIPDEYKIKDSVSKFLLKEILKDKVSKKILYQKKQGFVVPIELWLKNEAKGILRQELTKSEIYQKKTIEKLLNMFFQNKLHWSRIWLLFVLNRFLR